MSTELENPLYGGGIDTLYMLFFFFKLFSVVGKGLMGEP